MIPSKKLVMHRDASNNLFKKTNLKLCRVGNLFGLAYRHRGFVGNYCPPYKTKVKGDNLDQEAGIKIVLRAVEEPLRQIVQNAASARVGWAELVKPNVTQVACWASLRSAPTYKNLKTQRAY